MQTKTYLGDSVYAQMDYGQIVLTVENGFGPSQAIILEPEVYAALVEYVESALVQPEPG